MTVGSTADPRTLAEVSMADLKQRLVRETARLQEAVAGTTTITEGQIRDMIDRYEAELQRRGGGLNEAISVIEDSARDAAREKADADND